MPTARPQADAVPARDTTLAPSADTYIRRLEPNRNQGAEPILRLTALGKNRALLRWDQQALTQAVGGGTVTGARVELTIAELADNWSAAGRPVELHRMTHDWTELGATWNCAVDTAPADHRPSCTGATAWNMDDSASYPWVAAPTATAILKNGQTGVVSFEVTADVVAWLAGEPNEGWILRKADERAPGRVDFGSRESVTPPRLVLTVATASAPWPLLGATYPSLDTSRLVALAGDSALMFRTDIALRFASGVSDSAKRAFFAVHSMTVLGVTDNGQFFVRIPDPGPGLDQFYGALDRIRSYPEIHLAIPLWYTPLPQHEDLRLPSDGPGQTRSDWLNATDGTWAMRAIRAPLAWGCETGLYGDDSPAVGILEWKHQQDHPELARSAPVLREPSDPAMEEYEPVKPDTAAAKQVHAVATTGLLAAEGDNGSGIAGMAWRSRLYLYAGYDHQNRAVPLTSGFYVIAKLMVADQIRVLSISVDGGFFASTRPEDRKEQVQWVTETVRDNLLNPLPSLLVVVAAGNDHFRGGVASYLEDPEVGPLRAALLHLRDSSAYHDRIIVAGGTESGNQLWQGGNFFTGGATDIGAPALDVSVLGPWHGETGSSVPITIETGTSLSAPLVAGVAAQLLAMDSTLSPAQVKDYLVRGANQKRLSSVTGDSVAVQPVSGAPETMYQLDAYGSLTLLSRERPGTPICGFPVSLDPCGRWIALERPGHSETLTLGTDTSAVAAVGVAQGGRLISALMQHTDGAYGSLVVNQHGAVQTFVPGEWRVFLERDTVDGPAPWLQGAAPGSPEPTYVVRRGAGGPPLEVHPYSRAPNRPVCDIGMVAFAPSGAQLMLARQTWWPGADCSTGTANGVELWLMPVDSGGSPQLAWTSNQFYPIPWNVLWSHDSRRLINLTYTEDAVPFQITSVTSQGVAREFAMTQTWEPLDEAFSPDDSAMVSVESDDPIGAVCYSIRRDPATWVATASPQSLPSCSDVHPRIFPNAPPLRAASTQSARGFDLSAPGRGLQRAVAIGRRRWGSFSRVQVN